MVCSPGQIAMKHGWHHLTDRTLWWLLQTYMYRLDYDLMTNPAKPQSIQALQIINHYQLDTPTIWLEIWRGICSLAVHLATATLKICQNFLLAYTCTCMHGDPVPNCQNL